MITNNVIRLLVSKKIPYIPYELPIEKLGAIETAAFLNLETAQIFKTIVVVRGKGKPLLCVIPGDHEVNLKNVAEVVAEKKVSIPTQDEAETITGLQAGGISPLALINKGFSVLLDQVAICHDEIYISGGQRGLIIRINPSDVIHLTKAHVCAISTQKI